MSILLRPMTTTEFHSYCPRGLLAWEGSDGDDAEIMRQYKEKMLPNGISTPDEYLFHIVHNNIPVGTLWLGIEGLRGIRKAWVSDLEIYEHFRRRGFATKTLAVLDDFVRAEFPDIQEVALQVHGNNKAARAVYSKCGYGERTVRMVKRL